MDREANTSRETNENGKGGKNGRCYGDGAAMQASPHLLILLGNIGPLLLMNVTGRGEKVEPDSAACTNPLLGVSTRHGNASSGSGRRI
jgi:hypothetical protein